MPEPDRVPAFHHRLESLRERGYPADHPLVRKAYRDARVAVAERHLRQLAASEELTDDDRAMLVAAIQSDRVSVPDSPPTTVGSSASEAGCPPTPTGGATAANGSRTQAGNRDDHARVDRPARAHPRKGQ